MDDALQDLSLGTSQYAALNALEQTPQASSAELARKCFVTPQSMNEIVLKLEREGLLQRQVHPEHGRIMPSSMTKVGKKLLTQAHVQIEAIEQKMLSGLNPKELQILLKTLQHCSKNLE